jgi:hypothetical protein
LKTQKYLLLFTLILALTACKTRESAPLDQVAVQLKWVHQAQFAGFYTAEIKDRELQTAMLEASVPLIHTGEDQISWMRPEVWDEMHEILLTQGFFQEPLDLNKVHTLEFLQHLRG